MIAKLSAFGVSPLSLKLLYSYLLNRTQRIKINGGFSDRIDIEFGVPQGSILGPILDSELKFENHITEICLKVSKGVISY